MLWTGVRNGGCGKRMLRPDENTLHARRDADTNLTICGLPVAEVNWEFERKFIAYERSDGFDPNHYCHACIGGNSG